MFTLGKLGTCDLRYPDVPCLGERDVPRLGARGALRLGARDEPRLGGTFHANSSTSGAEAHPVSHRETHPASERETQPVWGYEKLFPSPAPAGLVFLDAPPGAPYLVLEMPLARRSVSQCETHPSCRARRVRFLGDDSDGAD